MARFSHIKSPLEIEYHYHTLDSPKQGFAPSGSSLPAHPACESNESMVEMR